MSWLCVFSLSCLANPAVPMSMPDTSLTQTNSAPAHVQPAPSPSAPLRCELHQAKRGGEQVLVAVVHAAAAAEGEYEFSVAARDAGRSQGFWQYQRERSKMLFFAYTENQTYTRGES
ncbi:hypothetical protein CFFPNG_04536 [Methylorubrum aminovorans]